MKTSHGINCFLIARKSKQKGKFLDLLIHFYCSPCTLKFVSSLEQGERTGRETHTDLIFSSIKCHKSQSITKISNIDVQFQTVLRFLQRAAKKAEQNVKGRSRGGAKQCSEGGLTLSSLSNDSARRGSHPRTASGATATSHGGHPAATCSPSAALGTGLLT
jgi:hypothetical protein